MRKHSKNSSEKFMRGSHNSLFKRQSFIFSFNEISFKEGITANNTNSHEIDESSEMAVTSFRDSAFTFKLTGLIDGRVDTGIGDKGLIGREICNIAYFGKKSSSCSFSDTIDRSDNLKLLNSDRVTEIGKKVRESIQLFHQMKECGDLLLENKFFSKTIRSDGVFSSHDNLLCTDRDLSTFTTSNKSLFNGISLSSSDKTCRRELFEKEEYSSCEDITDGFKFREGRLKDSFDFIFSRSNKIADEFSFSGNISEVFYILRNRQLPNRILMNHEELSNSKGVFFIGLGFTQREFSEIRDKKGINDNSVNFFGREERKEIDMVAASGFHASHDRGEVMTVRSNRLHKIRKPFFVHSSRQRELYSACGIDACSRKGIFGNINTYEKMTHSNTPVKSCLDKAGEASQPILQDDKGSKTQPTYYGFGRQGTDSKKGSMTQDIWSSPACPTLTGKTRLYKFYNTNS